MLEDHSNSPWNAIKSRALRVESRLFPSCQAGVYRADHLRGGLWHEEPAVLRQHHPRIGLFKREILGDLSS